MKAFFAALTLLMLTTPVLSSPPPNGASLAWTSNDPAVRQARALISTGELSQAETILKSAQTAEHGDSQAIAQSLEIIRRIRLLYPLDSAQILNKLLPQIRDLKPADIESWRKSQELQFRIIDGKPAYFSREPQNLFRFCPSAIERRISPPAGPKSVLLEHLAQVISQAKRTGLEQVVPVQHRVHFVLTVSANAAGAKSGSIVRAWLPFPQEYRQQSNVNLISASPDKPVISANGSPHRTLYFEQRITDPGRPVVFDAVFEYSSRAYYPVLDDAKVQPVPKDFPAEYLAERLPHIQFSTRLKETAAQIVGNETNPLIKARNIFHWVDTHIHYNAEEEYCVIPSLSERGLIRQRGDCGVQGMLYITLCRAAGVPARWQSGWETNPGHHDMHDWTEIYVAPWGWLPVDPSYGVKKSDDPAIREFYFGHQDAYRMIVNLDYGGSLTPSKKSLRSEPTDFQRGEVEIDGRNLYFNESDYDCEVAQLR